MAKHRDVDSQKLYTEFRKSHVRPWMRFWAKTIDLSIFSWILIPALFYLNIFTEQNIAHHTMRSLVVLFFWFLLVEPIFLSTWGTTLGRLLFHVNLLDTAGRKPTLHHAFSRSIKVWYAGFGFGLPLISLLTFYFSYRRLKNTGVTSWDKDKFVVTHGKIGFVRKIFILLLLLTPIIIGTAWQLHQHHSISSPKTSQIRHS